MSSRLLYASSGQTTLPVVPACRRVSRSWDMPMKSILSITVLGLLCLGAPVHAQDCKKGTVCRTLIENGYAHCKESAKARWRGIRGICKAAKLAGNPALCMQAIRDGFNEGVPNASEKGSGAETAVFCEDGQTECGAGCCPVDFPFCGASGVCCPIGYPIDCATFCCPSAFPFCGSDGACHSVVESTTTTTAATPTSTTIPGPTSCSLPPPPPDDACRTHLDDCHTTGCGFYPVGGCEARCSGGGFVCVGSVGTYTHCTSDADCPPPDAGFEKFTVCIPPFYNNDDVTFSCAEGGGKCAEPCP